MRLSGQRDSAEIGDDSGENTTEFRHGLATGGKGGG